MNSTATIIIFLIVVGTIYVLVKIFSHPKTTQSPKQDPKLPLLYQYTKKPEIMTKSEANFFKMLTEVAGERYYVFPQIRLSSILDNKVKGQNWQAALNRINSKSVDFILCDKVSLAPIYAIELDDPTHDTEKRQQRDTEVERMFEVAGLPLVRFRDYKNLTSENIAQKFYEAQQTQEKVL